MTGIDYAARVARGVALLDEKKPGWEHEIDLDGLDIASASRCITAQLSESSFYLEGMWELGLTGGNSGTYVTHGFNADNGLRGCDGPCCAGLPVLPEGYTMEAAHAALNAEWRRVITARLALVPASG